MFQTLFAFGLVTQATLVKMRKKNLNKFIINDNAPPFFLLGHATSEVAFFLQMNCTLEPMEGSIQFSYIIHYSLD
jgi:hypothetical protein